MRGINNEMSLAPLDYHLRHLYDTRAHCRNPADDLRGCTMKTLLVVLMLTLSAFAAPKPVAKPKRAHRISPLIARLSYLWAGELMKLQELPIMYAESDTLFDTEQKEIDREIDQT